MSDNLPPYQYRVILEKSDLYGKIQKLQAFRMTEAFKALDEAERDRLNRQLQAMDLYCSILIERIEFFGRLPA